MPSLQNRDVISIKDFSQEELIYIIKIAKKLAARPQPNLLRGKVLASLFFEPSTRTKLSFASAMNRLGGRVIGFDEPGATSLAKGETLMDTITMVEKYADIIVMRHPLEGSAKLAAEYSQRPVINAGDGAHQHPTQTMLDLYTIEASQGKLASLSIAMSGDLKYGRTVHSLATALAHFKTRLYFISPENLGMPDDILEELAQKEIEYSEHRQISEVINKIDILYATRIQKERFPDPLEYEKVKNVYIINKKELKGAKKNLRILHPLPRVNEIAREVDATPYAYYFQQAANGLYVRQALLALILGLIK